MPEYLVFSQSMGFFNKNVGWVKNLVMADVIESDEALHMDNHSRNLPRTEMGDAVVINKELFCCFSKKNIVKIIMDKVKSVTSDELKDTYQKLMSETDDEDLIMKFENSFPVQLYKDEREGQYYGYSTIC